MITVHMVLHAHLDPIWLWPWQAGLDEALATCRSACDRLDSNPDAIFTQGEAWVYQQVEMHDPELFTRIRGHIEAGRWEVTGGWWIQPDCNAPGGVGFEKQIACGKAYFLDRFGHFPEVAFNADSFGHAATLPGYMAAAGQKYYIMMRPQEHEMTLPARLFRWRGYTDGPDITTFRIARSYNASSIDEDHIRAAASDLPDGITHTMCFGGIGDHGGGPSEALITEIRDKADAFEGLKLIFSSPSRFFAAVADDVHGIPQVTGELQHHAVGCYTVHRPIKLGVKLGEHALEQASIALQADPAAPEQAATDLEEHWRTVAFMQFHDTLGGTCLPSAYRQVDAHLGAVQAFADTVVHSSVRRQLTALPDDPLQRLVFFNASEQTFSDWVEAEPWMGMRGWPETFSLLDEKDEPVPFQLLHPEAIVRMSWPGRILLRLQAGPGQLRVLRINEQEPTPEPLMSSLEGGVGWSKNQALCADLSKGIRAGDLAIDMPRLVLLEDPTDTWSHGIDRYDASYADVARWNAPVNTAEGPLLREITQAGHIANSPVMRQLRLGADDAYAELRYRVTWCEKLSALKVVIQLPEPAIKRLDGIPGGAVDRALDGAERPIRDWILLTLQSGKTLAIICPEIFAADVSPGNVRLTLLRSPQMAHHDPHPGRTIDGRTSDHGEHDFRIRILPAGDVTPKTLDTMAVGMLRPPTYADFTRGMPCHV